MKQAQTRVVMAQPYASVPTPQYQGAPGEFSTGLCDCFSDGSLCCLTCWCPCITFGRNAEIIDKGSSSCGVSGALYGLLCAVTGCQWIYACTYRSKLKAQYGMEESCCADCCTHYWCGPCALCQEYRELQHRGYDVALGWHGNMARQNPGMLQMPPTMPAGMKR